MFIGDDFPKLQNKKIEFYEQSFSIIFSPVFVLSRLIALNEYLCDKQQQ
jgi:hypothetical protein